MRFGVDVGGTTVKIGVIDNYKIIDSYSVVTKKETLFDEVCSSIDKYIKEHIITNVEQIGFGLPGHVVNNVIDFLPNIGIRDLNILDYTNKYFKGILIKSSNDANVAALGEALFDQNKPSSSYMLTLGTGVGGGYVIDNKVVDGAHCNCGEVGHMFVDYIHNYQCTCGLNGCLETVTSATGIVRLAKQYYNDYKTKLNYDTMSAKDIFDAAKEDDELGLYVLDLVGNYLARGLASIAVTTDVEVFYIGGGVSACGQPLIDSIKKYYVKYAHYASKNIEIKLASLGNKAGMLGAAYL